MKPLLYLLKGDDDAKKMLSHEIICAKVQIFKPPWKVTSQQTCLLKYKIMLFE